MARFWLGIFLLIAFLVLGLWVSYSMDVIHQTISDTLQNASRLALSGNSEAAAGLVRNARTDWEKCWHRTASVADHAPMDEIDGLFAQLPVYQDAQQLNELAAVCARLSQLVAAVGEAHKLTWWNFL